MGNKVWCNTTLAAGLHKILYQNQNNPSTVGIVRSELIGHRMAKANQIHGLVAECGLVAPQQLARLRSAIPAWLEDAENGLTSRFRWLLSGLCL